MSIHSTAPLMTDVRLGLALTFCLAVPSLATADPSGDASGDLTNLSFEELANLRVTSVSRRPERLVDAVGSIYVITAEDIRRSGATTLPEALRLAPNLHVAASSASGYAISARGMNGSISSAPNKLLVMIDGRSVYTPLFSGVFWDAQEVMLEDVERIEVVSGPGGTLWGVNAVNGVINVITRDSAGTTGGLVSAGTGNHESKLAFRHGGALPGGGHFRVHASARRHDNTQTEAGTPVDDAGRVAQAGFRVDTPRWGGDLTLSGQLYDGREGQPEPGAIAVTGFALELDDIRFRGTHMLGRYERGLTDEGVVTLQYYFDRTERTVPPTFAEKLDIHDLQFQHVLSPVGSHQLTWGLNFRHSRDRLENSAVIAFLPARLEQQWMALFAQDEISLSDELSLIAGVRFEHNDYSQSEMLPNLRLAWRPGTNQMWWAAASRGVRAPSRLDVDAYIPGTPPFLLDGGPRVRAEVADVIELGWRGQLGDAVSLSATAFHTRYDHLRTQEVDPSLTFLVFDSQMEGEVAGLEVWGTWQALSNWRIHGGLVVQDTQLQLKPESNDVRAPLAEGHDPSVHWQLRSSWTFTGHRELDLRLRHVGELERWDIDPYTALDLRFGWWLRPGLELSIAGQNLLGSHGEYRDAMFRTEHESRVYAQLRWEFSTP